MGNKDLRNLFLGLDFIGPNGNGPIRGADVTIGKLTKDKRRNISIAIEFKEAISPQVKIAVSKDRLFLCPVDKGGFTVSRSEGIKRLRVSIPVYLADLEPFEGAHKLHHIENADVYYIEKEEENV